MMKLKCETRTVLFEEKHHERFTRNNITRYDNDEECLRSLEEWIVKLLDSKNARGYCSKLKYCNMCVINIREGLKRYALQRQSTLDCDVMAMSEDLRNVLLARGYMGYSEGSGYSVKCAQQRHILGPLCGNGGFVKRKIRRKCRSLKSRNFENLKKQLDGSIRHKSDKQYLVDQLCVETRAVLAEDCVVNVKSLNEFGDYTKKSVPTKEIRISSSDHHRLNSSKYCEQLCCGDCKINGDSCDSFIDNFEELGDELYSSFKTSVDGSDRSRLKRDSDFDEGFSENESLDDRSISSVLNKTPESQEQEADYNSSNSKWSSHSQTNSSDFRDEDESESDGGTEILNSVNATVDKFNAIMEHSMTTGGLRRGDSCSLTPLSSSPPQAHPDSFTFGTAEQSHLPLTNGQFTYQDGREASSRLQHDRQPLSSLPLVDCDNISKVLLPPLNAQNWCSYSYNYGPARSSNYYPNQSNTFNISNAPIQNYDMQNLPPWLKCISGSIAASNTYDMPTNYNTAQLHRILLPPQLTIPSMNLGSMQHSIVHLPQLFQQPRQSAFDIEYLDRKYAPTKAKQALAPSHCNSSNDCLAPTSLNVASNTNNHSTSSLARTHLCQSIFKTSLDKSQRACCFYMRGGCKKEDCEYAHDLSKVTCKFWEKGDCFKADTCPFKHSYQKL